MNVHTCVCTPKSILTKIFGIGLHSTLIGPKRWYESRNTICFPFDGLAKVEPATQDFCTDLIASSKSVMKEIASKLKNKYFSFNIRRID